MPREYGTDPYGIIARGAPSGGRPDVRVSVGRVGIPMATIFPGVSAGTGVGGKLSIPIASTPQVKKKAEGGLAVKLYRSESGTANMNTPDYQDISQENPERIARQEAERAAVRERVRQQKAAIKAKNAEMRPQIEAARAERQAAADRNRAMSENLPLAAIHSGLNQALINQGASPEQRQAALNDLMSVSRSAPRALKGGPDMSALAALLGKYTTADQMNTALTERGRLGRFNPFDTYNTGVSDAAQRLRDLEAAQTQSRLAIEGSYRPQVARPMQPEMPALPAPVPQPIMALDERGNMLRQNPNSMAGIGGMPSATRTAPAPSFMPPRQPAMIAAPGGSTGFDERTGTYTRPPNIFGMFGSPLGMRPQPQQFGSGFTVGGLLGRSTGMMQPQQFGSGFTVGGLLGRSMGTTQPQPAAPSALPMAYKKGGAVKPVWDKKRPKDLGEPKSLSVKKKKAAKARAAAAGRPYPNLIDNMAAARKKGK